MVRSREELLELIKTQIGDDSSDDAIALVEDITDTYDDMATRISEAGDYKKMYEDNDAEWRQKYRDRFFHTSEDEVGMEEPEEEYTETEIKTFEDLFKTE